MTKKNDNKLERQKAIPLRKIIASTKLLFSVVILCITFLGGATFFAAWIAQNYFKAVWLDERLYLEKTQFLIEIEQNNSEMWEIQLNLEGQRSPQNKPLYMAAVYNFIRSVTTLIAWEEARVAPDSLKNTPIYVKNLTHTLAKRLLNDGNLDSLLWLATIATETKAKFQTSLDSIYFDQMNKSQTKAKAWNTRFLFCYIIGSLLLGARWVLANVFHWPNKLFIGEPEAHEEKT